MKLTSEGLALIKQFEGFRSRAYRDAGGVWTIGFGHTSMAGKPVVTPTLNVTLEEASEILRSDVGLFAEGVGDAVKVPLSDAQFSALVSFAYNVGLRNFKSSRVLVAVNRKEFATVPRLLGLWNKAGGRVLPGLVKRRAAEAAMFLPKPDSGEKNLPPDVPRGKPAAQSKTIWSAAVAALLAVLQFWTLATFRLSLLLILGGLLIALAIIIYERLKKSREEAI
jgi:GH24 family phage-related lysozyme (muramidase)